MFILYLSLIFTPANPTLAAFVGFSPPDPKDSADSYKNLYNDLGGQLGSLNEPTDEYHIELRVPDLKVAENAASVCVVQSFLNIRDIENIIKIQPIVNDNSRVIRMMVIGCSKPYQKTGYWDCLKAETLCQDDPQIVYSWGPNAPDVPLPPGVGFEIGSKSLLKYLVLEVDYEGSVSSRDVGFVPSSFTDQSGFALTISREPMHFKAGSYVFIGTGMSTDEIDVACTFSHENAIFPFGFAMIGDDTIDTISAFRVQNAQGVLDWDPIARGNPGWPQVFYPMEHVFKINNGDMLAIRCSRNYNYFMQNSATDGEYTRDESQCSLTFLFFTLVENKNTFLLCTQPGHPNLFSSIPRDYNQLIAEKTNILVENSYSKDVLRFEKLIQNQKEELQKVGHVDKDAGLQLGDEKDSDRNDNKIISHIDTPDASAAKEIKGVIFDNHWPANVEGAYNPEDYGEITGVATLKNGTVLFVHRADRSHTADSFDDYNFFQGRRQTIKEDVVVMLDSASGVVLNKFGGGLLVLPHGLYVDHEDYIYVTDIAKHQVVKFSLINLRQPMQFIGTPREPGSDASHFCQPTDVAVSTKRGFIFVADGYCNSRVVKLDSNGKFKEQFSLNDEEHTGINDNVEASSITVADSLSLVCAASYSHGLVHCFNMDSGESTRVIHSPSVFGTHLSAVIYSEAGSLFYILAAPSSPNIKTQAFSVDITTEQAMQSFSPGKETGFVSMTHDIVASPENQYVYVCDRSERKLYKFIQMEKSFLARGVSQGKSSKLVGDGSGKGFGGKFDDSFYSSLAILLLIAIPLTIVVTATIVSRSRAKSHPMSDHRKFVSWSSKKGYDKATLSDKKKKHSNGAGGSGSSNGLVNGVTGMLGGGKRGFHRLPSVDSDREADRLTDSETEEFTSQQVM